MEPVFMILGQSSALIAGLAIEGGKAVQDVDYELLKRELINFGQITK
jgi:hypothetical protein